MEKPCCELCRDEEHLAAVIDKKTMDGFPPSHYCKKPSCKCHLPKETCECAEPAPSHNGYCLKCMLWLPKQTPAPEKEGGKGYCNKCDLEVQPQMLCKCPFRTAPEKKWEEVEEELEYVATYASPERREALLSFLKGQFRQLLEEKAVEAGRKLSVVRERLEYIASRNELHNGVCIPAAKEALEAVIEAAAILRR